MKFDPKTLNVLSVRLHGKHIGVITRLAGDRQLLAFERDYVDDEKRPTLSLSFKGSPGGLVTHAVLLEPSPRRPPARISREARGRESRARILPPCHARRRPFRRACHRAA
jgi:hypothetical protein